MRIECVDKEYVIKIIKDRVKETGSVAMKWQLNQLIRKINETPTFFYDNNLVSSTLKDTETSNNTTLPNYYGHYQVLPSYYGDTMDLLTACEKGLVPREKLIHFCELNIIKYILRYKQKGGCQDLEKARTYLEKLITYENHEK